MTTLLRYAPHRWQCLSCDHTEVSHEQQPQGCISKIHPCRGMKLLSVPLVPAGTRGELVAIERQDYIGGEMVQTDAEGRPVMAVTTVRDDRQDATVYAPCAVTELES